MKKQAICLTIISIGYTNLAFAVCGQENSTTVIISNGEECTPSLQSYERIQVQNGTLNLAKKTILDYATTQGQRSNLQVFGSGKNIVNINADLEIFSPIGSDARGILLSGAAAFQNTMNLNADLTVVHQGSSGGGAIETSTYTTINTPLKDQLTTIRTNTAHGIRNYGNINFQNLDVKSGTANDNAYGVSIHNQGGSVLIKGNLIAESSGRETIGALSGSKLVVNGTSTRLCCINI